MDTNDQYRIEFTEECSEEIRKIYNYIKDNFDNKIAAKKLMNKVEKYTRDLAYAPKIYAEIEKYSGTELKYRRIVINNYIILYAIDEENKTIYISHMYYGGMNYMKDL